MTPVVSVLVPVLNEEAHLERTLDRMRLQQVPGGFEILTIDGGSSDRSGEILERIAAVDTRVRVLANPGRRTPHALNIGLRAARGEYIARMDAHAFYPPDYLALGIARLQRGDVASVNGPAIAQGTSRGSRRVALALSTRFGVGGASFRRGGGERDVDSGFAGVWHRETLERCGGWDEGWPINQDAELAARIQAQGGRIVCLPEMSAQYVPREKLKELARQYWNYGQYRVKTFRRHPLSMRRSHVMAPGAVLTFAAAVVPGPQRSVARAGVAAWALAAVGFAGREAARGAPIRDAAALPAIFAVMHAAWGVGFFVGCARYGPPIAALARLLRRGR